MDTDDALKLGIGLGVIGIVVHTVVHAQFLPTLNDFLSVGALQANIPIFLSFVVGMYLMNKAVKNLAGIKLFLASVLIWILPAIGHDGTHLLYIPLEDVLAFGLYGVPESGISYAVVYTAGMIYIWYDDRY